MPKIHIELNHNGAARVMVCEELGGVVVHIVVDPVSQERKTTDDKRRDRRVGAGELCPIHGKKANPPPTTDADLLPPF